MPFAIPPAEGTTAAAPPWDMAKAQDLLGRIFQYILREFFHPVVPTRQQNYEFCAEKMLNFSIIVASDQQNANSAERLFFSFLLNVIYFSQTPSIGLYKIKNILKLLMENIGHPDPIKIATKFNRGVYDMAIKSGNAVRDGQALWNSYSTLCTLDLDPPNIADLVLYANNVPYSGDSYKAHIIIGEF